MRDEYDFSIGERGKFYRQEVKVHLPSYLETELPSCAQERAAEAASEASQPPKELLRQGAALGESTRRPR